MALFSKFLAHGKFMETGQFRFTQPNSLNDPYEALPAFVMERHSAEDIDAAREKAANHGMPDISEEDLKALFLTPFTNRRFDEKSFPGLWPALEPRLRQQPFPTLAEYDKALAEKAVGLFRAHADKNTLVFSLSKATASDLMWAYYGASDEGFEIRFHADHPFFSDRSHEVQYTQEPAYISSNNGWMRILGKELNSEDILENRLATYPMDLLLRKKIHWEHEQEVRLLRQPGESSNSVGSDHYGNEIYLFEIPPDAVESIVIGYRTNKENIDKHARLIRKSNKLKHSKILLRVFTHTRGIHEEEI